MTQNTQEEAEDLKIRRQETTAQEEKVSLNHPDQENESNTHRRRRQTPESLPEQVPVQNERRIPGMPKAVEDQTIPASGKSEKSRKRLSGPRTHSNARFTRAADAAGKRGKTLLKGLGGLIVLLLMMAQDGLKSLSKTFGNGRERAEKPRSSERTPVAQEYELTPVRPEDYHGRGKAHAQQTAAAHKHALPAKNKTSAKKNQQTFNRIAAAALMCVALFSAWQIGSILLRSIRTTRLNQELSQQRAEIISEQQEMNAAEPEQQQIAAEPAAQMQPETAAEPVIAAAPDALAAPDAPAATAAPDIVKTTKYHGIGGDALPEMAALYEKNRDLVAWIQIPEVLDLPVVYRNNDYYLTRDFNKQKNASGTIFLDVNHPFKERTQNLLLHGHNMKDGTMFGHLVQYLHDDTYLRYHPFIYFDTLWHKEQYVIFAVLNVSLNPKDERFFNYFTHDTFSSDIEFEMYIRQLQLRSQYAIPIDVQPTDALLTLSTCLDEDRLVIVCRRLRENETRSELRTLIRMSTRQ